MDLAHAGWNRTDALFILICAVFLYFHLFTLSGEPFFYEEDHLYFVQDAWRMYRGEALYKDFFQYTFPGTQVLYYGLMRLFGTQFWIISAVIFIQGLSHSVIALAISKHIFRGKWIAYLSSGIFLFFGFRWFGIDGSHRMLSPLFIALAILILLHDRTPKRIFFAGIFCALASYFTQQRGFVVVCAIAFFLLIETVKNKSSWKSLLKNQFILGASFAGSLFILISPFIISVGPERFFEYTILYIRNYVQEPTANYGAYGFVLQKVIDQGYLIGGISLFYYILIPLVFPAAFVFLWRKKYQAEILLISLVGLSLSLATFAPTPYRLFQICLPAIICLVWLISLIKVVPEIWHRAAVVALIIFGCALTVRLQTAWQISYLDAPTGNLAFTSPIPLERYQWLKENAEPGEYVFEVYQTAVNFPLQHPNPTRVTYLLDSGFTPEWMVLLAIENLEEKKPRFIIWDGKFSKEKSERNADDHIAPLYDYLRQNYVRRQQFTPYSYREMEIWQRK
jgi:hypothetical protein